MRCDECDAKQGHEIWCSVYRGPRLNTRHELKSTWIVVLKSGREMSLDLAPGVSQEFADDYARTRFMNDMNLMEPVMSVRRG